MWDGVEPRDKRGGEPLVCEQDYDTAIDVSSPQLKLVFRLGASFVVLNLM